MMASFPIVHVEPPFSCDSVVTFVHIWHVSLYPAMMLKVKLFTLFKSEVVYVSVRYISNNNIVKQLLILCTALLVWTNAFVLTLHK